MSDFSPFLRKRRSSGCSCDLSCLPRCLGRSFNRVLSHSSAFSLVFTRRFSIFLTNLALQRRFGEFQRYFRGISIGFRALTHASDRAERAPGAGSRSGARPVARENLPLSAGRVDNQNACGYNVDDRGTEPGCIPGSAADMTRRQPDGNAGEKAQS